MFTFIEISILFQEGIIKKISYERRAYDSVGEKEPILGYVPKNHEKKNLVHKGLEKTGLVTSIMKDNSPRKYL